MKLCFTGGHLYDVICWFYSMGHRVYAASPNNDALVVSKKQSLAF